MSCDDSVYAVTASVVVEDIGVTDHTVWPSVGAVCLLCDCLSEDVVIVSVCDYLVGCVSVVDSVCTSGSA